MANEYYALITGASSGIGKAFSEELASRGHNLIIHSLPGEGLEKTGESIMKRHNVKVRSFEIDLTELEGPDKLFRAVKENDLQINILINNAGTGIEGPLEHYSKADIDRIIFLNIRALTLLTSLFTPDLKRTNSYLLNVSSFGTYIPTPYKSVYLASKSYIFYFTRALEAEFQGTNVKTCIVVPGGVRTNQNVLKRMEHAGWMSKSTSITPEVVAYKGIRAMFRGKRVFIPGGFMRLIFFLGLIVPQGIILSITRKIFHREYSV